MVEKQITGIEKPPRLAIPVQVQTLTFILISVVLGAAGQLLFKAALNQIGELNFALPTLVRLVTSPTLILGLLVFGASALLWLFALMKADLSFAYPFLSVSYIVVMLGGVFFFGDSLTWTRVLGVFFIALGLIVIAQDGNSK